MKVKKTLWGQVMKYIAVTLLMLTVSLWSYNAGALSPRPTYDPLMGLHEAACDDINLMHNAYTDKDDIVCEVNMTSPDQLVKVYK